MGSNVAHVANLFCDFDYNGFFGLPYTLFTLFHSCIWSVGTDYQSNK